MAAEQEAELSEKPLQFIYVPFIRRSMQRSLSPTSQPTSLSPSSLSKRRVSPPAQAPCDLRLLKTKVARLLASSYARCRSCVRKHTITPQNADLSLFLEANLPRSEFELVVHDPHFFIPDSQLCKALIVDEEPSWDYLLAHDPEEITPLHLFYKKKNEEKRMRVKLQREELQRKRDGKRERVSFPGTSKPIIRVRPAALFDQQVSPYHIPIPLISSKKLTFPHIGSVPLLLGGTKPQLVRSKSTEKSVWKQLNDTFVEAERKYREKVAKTKENYGKKQKLPLILEQKRENRTEKTVEISLYGEPQREFVRRKTEKRLTQKEGMRAFSRLQKLL